MPDCLHFGTCGGCSLLDQAIADQLAAKRARLVQLLEPFLPDGLEPQISVSTDAQTSHYRTRILYPVQPDQEGLATLGIYRRGSHELVRLQECQIQLPLLTEFGRRAEQVFRDMRLQPYDETQHAGDLRAFVARLFPSTNELLLGFVTTGPMANAETVAMQLQEQAVDLGSRPVGVVHNIHPQRGNALLGPTNHTLLGVGHQHDDADQLRFRVSFSSFYQLHRDVDELLYEPSMNMLGDLNGQRLVDGYAGVGTFGLRAARRQAAVTLIESHPSAIDDASHNIAHNSLQDRVTVRHERFEDTTAPTPDVLIVDPSRAGLRPAGVERLQTWKPERVLYVSCNPASLARDLAGLSGYRIDALRIVDLFPHTEHMEAVVLLRRS